MPNGGRAAFDAKFGCGKPANGNVGNSRNTQTVTVIALLKSKAFSDEFVFGVVFTAAVLAALVAAFFFQPDPVIRWLSLQY